LKTEKGIYCVDGDITKPHPLQIKRAIKDEQRQRAATEFYRLNSEVVEQNDEDQ